jgi:hypothetical protein
MAQIDTLTNVGAVVSTDLALILRGGANVLGTFGSLVGQNSTAVSITGGTINGTTIGATTPASVAATTLSTTGSASLTNILLLGGTLPGAGNPSISLRSSDNVLYMQSGSANSVTILDSAQNTMQSTTATQHQWNISNVPKMTLDASGNLTNTGAATFGGAVNGTDIALTKAAGVVALSMNASAYSSNWTLYSGAGGANALGFYDGSAYRLTINPTGIDVTGAATFGGAVTANTNVFVTGAGANSTRLDLEASNTAASIIANYGVSAVPLDFYTGALKRMTLDASGNLVLPTAASYILLGGSNSAVNAYIQESSSSIILGSANAPRMTLDASGRLGINVTPSSFGSPMLAVEQTGADWTAYTRSSNATPYGLFVKYTATPNNTSNPFLRCDDGTSERFNIASNGNVFNFTGAAIGTISDVRLKENITPATPKLADILKVEIINYNRIGSEQKLLGVKAHQLKEVFPSLVDTRDTREYDDEGCVVAGFEDELHVKVGFDFATYTKCFQEQQAIIESLTARIEALEGAK